jgi:hypothetical protein
MSGEGKKNNQRKWTSSNVVIKALLQNG